MIKTLLQRSRNLLMYGHYIPVDYFVFDDLRLVYISVPKVACTSIKIALMADSTYGEDRYSNYMRIHHDAKTLQHQNIPEHARSYFKFAFVRNPFDRLVSFYEDKVRRPVQHDGRYYFDTGYNKRLIKSLYGSSFTPDMTFVDFARLVSKIPDWIADAHFKSQSAILSYRGQLIPDFIGHFENIDHDWATLASKHGTAPLLRKNPSTAPTWHSYYSDRSVIDLVAERYHADIRNFGYQAVYDDLLEKCRR